MNISDYDGKELTNYFKLLLLAYINPDKAKEQVSIINEAEYEYDLNIHIINYLLLNTNKEKFSYIMDVVLPQAYRSSDEYSIDYFILKLSQISIQDFKYKPFTLCYSKLKNHSFSSN